VLAVKICATAIVLLFAGVCAAVGQNVVAEQPTRIRVSERVLYGLASKKVLPIPPYPPCSKDSEHKQGVVTVAVLVDSDGRVRTASLMQGDPVLGDCATAAVREWQFKPYLINENPVQVESRVVMRFSKKRVELLLGQRSVFTANLR
jgi:TonB family protein